MRELIKAKLIFWGSIFFGAIILPLFLLVIIGKRAWFVWGILVLIFIFGSGLPFKIWLALQLKRKKKRIYEKEKQTKG